MATTTPTLDGNGAGSFTSLANGDQLILMKGAQTAQRADVVATATGSFTLLIQTSVDAKAVSDGTKVWVSYDEVPSVTRSASDGGTLDPTYTSTGRFHMRVPNPFRVLLQNTSGGSTNGNCVVRVNTIVNEA